MSLWRAPDFRRLWIGETASQLGSAVTGVALPLVAVTTLHAGTFLVTLVSASTWAPWLVLGPLAGAWVDRTSRRRMMLACDVVSMAAFASVPIARWCGVLSLAQLAAVAALAGASAVFFTTAYAAFLPSLLAPKDLPEGNAKLTGSRSAAQIGGPGLGGAIAQAAGAATGLLVDAVSFAVSFASLLGVRGREKRPAERDRAAGFTRELLAGIAFVARDPYLRPMMAFAAAANLFLTALDALLVVFLVRNLGESAGAVGLAMSLSPVGGVLGAIASRRLARALGSARAIIVCALGGLPFALLVPLAQRGWGLALVIVANAALAAGVVAANVIVAGFQQTYVPRGLLGRVSACSMTVAYSTMPVGALLAGVLAGVLGMRPTLWVVCAGLALCGAILLPTPIRRRGDLPGAAAPAATAG